MSGRADGLNDVFDNSIVVKKNIDTNSGTIQRTPTEDIDIVNKKYVDVEIAAIPETTPAGSDGEVQFNNAGSFGASSDLFWDNVNKRLGIGNDSPSFNLDIIAPTVGGNEDVMKLRINDAPNDFFSISNSTAISKIFSPIFISKCTASDKVAAGFSGRTTAAGDTGLGAMMVFDVRRDPSAAIVNRAAFRWTSYTTEYMRILANGNLGIGTSTPDTKLQVVGDCKFGDDNTNYSTFETTGFMEATGTAKAYRDINIGGYLLTRPASGAPDVVNFVDEAGADTAIPTYAFDIGEKVSGGFELQHDYAQGTDLVFHTHFQGIAAPTGTDNVQWRLTYILMRDGETLNAAVTIDSPDAVVDTQYETVRADFAAITGTNFLIGDQFMFTLERVAATGDAYAGDALIGTAGIHYQVNTLGSRTIVAK